MKKSAVVFLTLVVCISTILASFYLYKTNVVDKNSKQILERTYQLIDDSNNVEKSENTIIDNIVMDDNMIGVLIIPKLDIEAPIKDGTTQEVMKTCIGHFIESDYWDGNVSLASHNGGINAHYFEKINTLGINDEIEYITRIGTKKYKVEKVFRISSNDWSEVVSNQENNNTITLITCINGLPNYRLCVKGIEV